MFKKRKRQKERHDEMMGAVADMQRQYGMDPGNIPSMADMMRSAATGAPLPGQPDPQAMMANYQPDHGLQGPDPLDELTALADRYEAGQVDDDTFAAERQRLLDLL